MEVEQGDLQALSQEINAQWLAGLDAACDKLSAAWNRGTVLTSEQIKAVLCSTLDAPVMQLNLLAVRELTRINEKAKQAASANVVLRQKLASIAVLAGPPPENLMQDFMSHLDELAELSGTNLQQLKQRVNEKVQNVTAPLATPEPAADDPAKHLSAARLLHNRLALEPWFLYVRVAERDPSDACFLTVGCKQGTASDVLHRVINPEMRWLGYRVVCAYED